MGRINFVQEQEATLSKGMDTTSQRSTIPQGYVELAQNANVGLGPGYIKRDGFASQLDTDWAGFSIRQGIEYTNSISGLSKLLLFGTDDSTDGRFGEVIAGAVSTVKSGLSASARLSFVQFSDLLFAYNGSDAPFLYNGSSTRQVGIVKPTLAPTLNTTNDISPTDGLAVDGKYLYAYTYRNSVTRAESSPSPVSDLVDLFLTTPDNEVILDVVPGDPATADEIVVYRTTSDGNILLEEGVVGIAATTFTSNIPDAGLSTRQLEIDNSRITDFTSEAEFPVVAQSRIFVKIGPNQGRFSKVGQSGPMPESFEAKAFFDTEGSFGSSDDIVGLAEIKDIPLVLKKRSIGRLEQVGLRDFTSSSDKVAYIYKEISNNTGAISHWAGDEVFDEYVFLSKDNIYATNGVNVRPVANRIQETIRRLGFKDNQRTKISAKNNKDKKRILFSVFASPSQAEPDYVIVGDYQAYPEFRWTVYSKGKNGTTHPAYRVGCFFEVEATLDGAREVFFGNTDQNGKLFKTDSGESDDGSGIDFKVITRPEAFNQPLVKKLYKDLDFWAEGKDNTYELTVCAIYDLTRVEKFCKAFTLPSSGNTWGDPNPANNSEDVGLWDVGTWGGNENDANLAYTAHKRARYQQLTFRQADADAPVSLMRWGTSGSMGRPFRSSDSGESS